MKKLQNTSMKVYYDSTCPLCTAFKVFSEKGTNEQEVQFQNVQADTTPHNLSETDLLTEIYAIDTSGNTTKGSDAIFTILKNTSGLTGLVTWVHYQ